MVNRVSARLRAGVLLKQMRFCALAFIVIFSAPVSFSKTTGIVFTKKKMILEPKVELSVEVAETWEQKAQGLMGRTQLKDAEGMLFVSDAETYQSFWMKNTLIALSIGFFDKDKKLLEVIDMYPPMGPLNDEQLPRYNSQKPAQYALEVPLGWFSRKKIKVGTTFKLK